MIPIEFSNVLFADYIRRKLEPKETTGLFRGFFGSFFSGAIAGGATLLFVYPFDFIRTKIALDQAPTGSVANIYKDSIKTFSRALYQGSININDGIYKGFATAATGIAIYRGINFALCRLILGSENETTTPTRKYFLGGVAGMGAALLTYPFDTIRVRLINASVDLPDHYTSGRDCFQQTLRNEGWKGLYRGAGAFTLQGFVGGLCVFLIFPFFCCLFFFFFFFKKVKFIFISKSRTVLDCCLKCVVNLT